MPQIPKEVIIEWDAYNWGRSLSFWKSQYRLDFADKVSLEIGSRNGGLSLWLASMGASVVCSDLFGPTEKAKKRHMEYGLSKNISYGVIDATAIPYKNHFDIVIFKSVLGGIGMNNNIEKQKVAIDSMYAALRPGGWLLFAENMVSTKIHMIFRRIGTPWGREWRYITEPEMKLLLNKFENVCFDIIGFSGAFGRTEKQRKILGIADYYFFEKIVPNTWKYILLGAARKP